ncbi:hypothetical protein Micbo1qcDRAFT_232948 [Microdochium bolleyi]|uniref:ABM domain-containing protein n=1 Tax=Microdochium bolleyi TaxID=196109 RepID=A0A136J8B3_9PEZI|nr:hypothetical protein Micbo1qcDRAFT_232948 [Microdochium bolleyi]
MLLPNIITKIFMTTAHLQAKSRDARGELLGFFANITAYAREHEAGGVLRYVATVPWDEADETSIYMIEQYADQAAWDAHSRTPPVQALVQHLGAGGALASPPEIYNWTPSGDARRANITGIPPDPVDFLMVYGTLDYPPNSTMPGAGGGTGRSRVSAVAEAYGLLAEKLVAADPLTYGATFFADEDKGQLRIVEMFASRREFLEGPHRTQPDVLEFKRDNAPGGMELVQLRYVDGFLAR